MYANSTIHFRDPFKSRAETLDSRQAYHDHYRASWNLHAFNQSLTPPPEMNGAHTSKATKYQQEHAGGAHYGDYMPGQQAFRAPVAPYLPQEVSNAEFGRHGLASHTYSRRTSPTPPLYYPGLAAPSDPQQRTSSQANVIAPSFQIPKSVNESGGSLSELAAEITCLFWFESSDLLQQVEDGSIYAVPPKKLVKDARPTTGFRKWVTTILSTTCVAQNVVLLALLFIHRLKKLNPTVKGKPGSEYRLLTVALMLGNKFLDDNTYTNKTWAEVSGINVGEVHIMEVEFLSNMKYCLFTSAEDWADWQRLLGKYAEFLVRSQILRPPPTHPPAPILPPASSLHLPMALPSPPISNQASPPYVGDLAPNAYAYGSVGQHGLTPAPSPLELMPRSSSTQQASRKRSHDDHSSEPPAKRLASGYHDYSSPLHHAQTSQNQRLTLPSLSIPPSQAPPSSSLPVSSQGQQLPPLNVPARAMAMVYQNANSSAPAQTLPPVTGPSSLPPSQIHSQYQSRQQSPYPGSGANSPTSAVPHSATMLHPPTQVSPSYFLQQRNSPYRPVHNVSTLLYPPPSIALHHRPQSVEHSQMHYQPLSKSFQQRQTGRLPYVSQNVWLDGNQQQAMTPVHQWPSFMSMHQQQRVSQPGN